jgi:hypothetical protein
MPEVADHWFLSVLVRTGNLAEQVVMDDLPGWEVVR